MAVIFARLLPALFRSQQQAQALAHALPAYAHARAMHRALQEAAEAPAGRGGPRMELRSALTVRDASFTYQAGAESGTGIWAEAQLGRGTATEPGAGAGFETAAGVAGGAEERQPGCPRWEDDSDHRAVRGRQEHAGGRPARPARAQRGRGVR